MEFPFTEELQILVLRINHFVERLEWLGIWSPAILETTTVVVGVFVRIVGVGVVLLVE